MKDIASIKELGNYLEWKSKDSEFKASMPIRGGYIVLKNSSRRGDSQAFNLGIDSFLQCFVDILNRRDEFVKAAHYNEDIWRALARDCLTDESAQALFKVQTKPMFSTLSKIVSWANQEDLIKINTDKEISLKDSHLENTIKLLEDVAKIHSPLNTSSRALEYEEDAEDFSIARIKEDLPKAGLYLQDGLINRFVCSLLTKPFVLLTGLSGSGKTKLAQAFAQWIVESPSQICMVPVGADWTSREPLLGFPNALEKGHYVKPETGVLDLLLEASKPVNQLRPFFLILDEMNLSHVERYFADFLSCMESSSSIFLRPADKDWIDEVPPILGFTSNVFIIGTVNIDETTYMFSPKVLDRANVIEFRVTQADMQHFLDAPQKVNIDAVSGAGIRMARAFIELAFSNKEEIVVDGDIKSELLLFFEELSSVGAEFGFRSAIEILRFVQIAIRIDSTWNINGIIDACIMQKLLPKLHGSRRKLEPVLVKMGRLCFDVDEEPDKVVAFLAGQNQQNLLNVKYPLALNKISRMYQRAIENGFTSYSEA